MKKAEIFWIVTRSVVLALALFLTPGFLVLGAEEENVYAVIEMVVNDGPTERIVVRLDQRAYYEDKKGGFEFTLVCQRGKNKDEFVIQVQNSNNNTVSTPSKKAMVRHVIALGRSVVRARILRLAGTAAEAIQIDPDRCQSRGSLILYEGLCTIGCDDTTLSAVTMRRECGVCCTNLHE